MFALFEAGLQQTMPDQKPQVASLRSLPGLTMLDLSEVLRIHFAGAVPAINPP